MLNELINLIYVTMIRKGLKVSHYFTIETYVYKAKGFFSLLLLLFTADSF